MDYEENEQCFFCPEITNLIHMDTNSLIIDFVYIDFSALILDLLQIKLDDDSSNMICEICKDQLSQFYIMKQRAKTLHQNVNEIRKLQIVDAVSRFLNSMSDDCVISKFPRFLAIHPVSNSSILPELLYNCSATLDSEIEDPIEYSVGDLKQEAEEFSETYELAQFEVEEENIENHDEMFSVIEDVKFEETIIENEEISVKRRSKKQTLDVKQREWVKKEVKESAVVLQTSFGVKSRWKCNKCFKKLSSENAFRTHLKSHFDENSEEKQLEIKAKRQPTSQDDVSFVEQKLWIQQQLQNNKSMVETPEGPKQAWKCSECDFNCSKRSRFRHHLQKYHSTIVMRGPNKHSCFSCHLRFDGENHLQVHKNCHRIFDVIAPHVQFPSCDHCKLFFCSQEDIQIHNNRHKESPQSLRDPILAVGVVHRNGETFINDDDDLQEILDESSPTCGHCLMKFSTENDCKIHLMLFHLTVFTCPFDAREFSGIPTLSFGNHLRQCHPDIFPDLEIKCSLCQMQFENVYEKLAHMKKCQAKLFQCDHCERSFFRKTELLHHLKVAIGLMVFACEVCGKRCKDQGDLKTHIRMHTNIRPYPCPHCEKAYKTSSARASHVESHMEQTHECNVCHVKFRRRILYQRHMKLLHDEAYRQKCFAENTCTVCGKSYLRRTHYKNHIKIHSTLFQ